MWRRPVLILTDERGPGAEDIHGFAFDVFRATADIASSSVCTVRRHGPFEPHRLPLGEMEYTTVPAVSARLAGRWETVGAPAVPAISPAITPA